MIKVAAGIIMRKERVLLCQRRESARYALKWEFPGGKLEREELPEECLRRELHEELGINATVGDLFHRQHYQYADSGLYDVFYYLVSYDRGRPVNKAFASFRWVSLEDLPRYDILEGNKDVVRKIVETYAGAEPRDS